VESVFLELHPEHIFVGAHFTIARVAHPNGHKALCVQHTAAGGARLAHAPPAPPAVVSRFEEAKLRVAQGTPCFVGFPFGLEKRKNQKNIFSQLKADFFLFLLSSQFC